MALASISKRIVAGVEKLGKKVSEARIAQGTTFPNKPEQLTTTKQTVNLPSGPAGRIAHTARTIGQMVASVPRMQNVDLPPVLRATEAIDQLSDKQKASELQIEFLKRQRDPASQFYNPYALPTNKAVEELYALGIDARGGFTPDLMQYKGRTGTGTSPLAPTTKSTQEENIAYWVDRLKDSEYNTVAAETEWAALQKEITALANSPNNYSDDEILSKIDYGKYSTLRKMDEGRANYEPLALNRAVGYSSDALKGAIWAARNDGGSGDPTRDAIRYYRKEGNQYVPDETIRAQRDVSSPAYNPYTRANIEDTQMYFGVDEFTRDTLEQIRPMLADGKAETQKQFAKAVTAVETAEKAEAERAALLSEIDQELRYTNDPEKILNYLRYKDGDPESGERSDFSTLWKMDKGRFLGDPVSLGFGVDYRWEDIEASVRERASVQQAAFEAAQADEAAQAAANRPRTEAAIAAFKQTVGLEPAGPAKTAGIGIALSDTAQASGDAPIIPPRMEVTEQAVAGALPGDPAFRPNAAETSDNGADVSRLGAATAAGVQAMASAAQPSARAGEGLAERYIARMIGLDASTATPTEIKAEQEAFLDNMLPVVRAASVGKNNAAVFTDADASRLAYLENLLAEYPENETADYWQYSLDELASKRRAYSEAYWSEPTYQQKIAELGKTNDSAGIVETIISGLHIHSRFDYKEISEYLTPALSKATPDELLARGMSEYQIEQVEQMRDSIQALYARPVPTVEPDGWAQEAGKAIVDLLQGQGAWERTALNDGMDAFTVAQMATNDMFSLLNKSMLGVGKMALLPVQGGMELLGAGETYRALEDRLINNDIAVENGRLEASREALLKHGSSFDLLSYQITRDVGKAALELNAIGGVAQGAVAAGASTKMAREATRVLYGLSSAGSTVADVSLEEGVDTMQWLGAGLVSGLVTYGVSRLGVEDKVLGRLLGSGTRETTEAVMQMGATKYIAEYGRKGLRFLADVLTGAAGEYLEEALEQGISEPLTDAILGKPMQSFGEYARQANQAGVSGALVGGILGAITFSAATPIDTESHKALVTMMENAEAGRGVTAGELLGLGELVRQDMQDGEIAGPVLEQAGEMQASLLVMDKIASGAMDAVYDGPEAKAAESARVELEQAGQRAQAEADALAQARSAADEAKAVFLTNPADRSLLSAYEEKLTDVKKAGDAHAEATSAYTKAAAALETAEAEIDALGEATLAGLHTEAAQEIVVRGKQEQAAAMGAQMAEVVRPATDSNVLFRTEGAVPGVAQDAEAAQAEPSAREVDNPLQITRQLAHDLGIGSSLGGKMAAEGKRLPGEVRGFYDQRGGYMATRAAGDYETTMHELGHALSGRLSMEGTPEMVAKLGDAFQARYDADVLPKEAFSEFFRLYMTNPEMAAEFAGADYVRDFEKALRGSPEYDAVKRGQDSMQAYLNATFADRVDSMVIDRHDPNPNDLDLGERLKNRLRNATTSALDWTRPAADVDMAIRDKTGAYPEGGDRLQTAALWRNFDDRRAAGLLTNALTDAQGTIIGKSLSEALGETGIKGADFDSFSQYLLLRHSFDRDAQGKPVFGEGFSSEQRRAYVQELEQAHPEFAEAAAALHDWWRGFMQAWMVDTGYLAQADFDRMNEMYPNYVPTMRFIEGKSGRGRGGKFAIKGATGSDREIYNPFDSMVDILGRVVRTVSQNNVGLVWDALYQENEGLGIFGREVTAEVAPKAEADAKPLIEGEEEIPVRTSGTQGALEVVRPDGTRAYYEIFDKALLDMFEHSGKSIKTGFEALGRATRGMTMLTTGSNPAFAITNVIRDFQKSVNYGSWASNYATGAAKWVASFYEVWRNKGGYQDYKAMGGGGWNRVGVETRKAADAYRADLFPGYDTATVGRAITKGGKKLWSAVTLSALNEHIENASRYAEYRFGKHDTSTETGRLAAYMAAQEATVDFARSGSGETVNALRKVVPFLNANLQGTYQTGRMFTKAEADRAPARFAKTMINGALATALAYGLRQWYLDEEDREAYGLLADDIKNGYLILPNPFESDRRFIRIPIAQDPLAKAAHGMVRSILDSGESDPFVDEIKTVGASILAGLNPVSSTILDPILSIQTNKSWYGGDIVSRGLSSAYVTNQYDETTPDIFIMGSRALNSRNINVSPKHLEYIAKQYSGWIGDMLLPAISKNRYTGELGGLSASIKGLANRLTTDPAYSNDITDSFYQSKTFLEQVRYSVKNEQKLDMLRDDLTEAEAEDAYLAAKQLLGTYEDATDRIGEMWSEIDEISRNDTLTQSQKNSLTRGLRMDMLREMLVAEEGVADFTEAFVTGRSTIPYVANGGVVVDEPTAIIEMPDRFKNDLADGAEYMARAEQVFAATGKSGALPHPNKSFTADKVEYVIPDDRWGEWELTYTEAYRRHVDTAGRKWEAMSDEERLDVMMDAHAKGHDAAKKWFLRYGVK